MKNIITKSINAYDFFKSILPDFGTRLDDSYRKPRWIPGQKYWLISEYRKEDNGNYYYVGARFVDNLMIIEKGGMAHSWTFLDDLEIYAFDNKTPRLIQKKSFTKCYRNEDVVRSELENMLSEYARGQAKLTGVILDDNEISKMSKNYIDRSFKDFLDADYEIKLTRMMPLLLENK